MKRTFIPLMYDCNNNCISCPVKRRGERNNPHYSEIIEDIEKISLYSKTVALNGGEPTLRKDIFKILKYASSRFEEINLLTNAERFYHSPLADKVSTIKNVKIVTTIYGHNSPLHDAITKTPGSFERKISGIKNLIRNRVTIELRIMLHKMNSEYFENMASFIISNFRPSDFCKTVIMSPKLTASAKRNASSVMQRLASIAPRLTDPVQKLVSYGFRVELFHFPHCVISRSIWPYSKGMTAEEGEAVFLDSCELCRKKEVCSGIWGSYLLANEESENEFIPIEK